MNLPGRGYLPSFGWPDFEVLEVQPFISADFLTIPSITIDCYDDSWLSLPSVSGYTMQSPELKGLDIDVSRTWLNPKQEPDANDEWTMHLTGPWSQLDKIDSVEYAIRFTKKDANYISKWRSKERYSLHSDGFPGFKYTAFMRSVTATVHYLDGRDDETLTWSAKAK